MPALESVQWLTMLYSLIVFIVLFYLLSKYAFGPLMKVMEDRADKIEQDISNAQQQREKAQELLAKQEALLAEARQDAQKVIENARSTAEKQSESIIQTAKEETEQFKTVARKELEREKEKAIEALRAEVGHISVLLAEKVIEKEIDAAQQQKLVDEYLKEVGSNKWVQ